MATTDDLVTACAEASAESDPKSAVREILGRFVG